MTRVLDEQGRNLLRPDTTAGVLIGRGTGSNGFEEQITLGSNLYMSGTVLHSTGGSSGGTVSTTSGKVVGRSSGTGDVVSVTIGSGLSWNGDAIYSQAASGAGLASQSGTVLGRSSGAGFPANVSLSSGLYWDGDAIAVNAVSGLQATSGKLQGRSSGTGTPINVTVGSGLGWTGDAIYSLVASGADSVTLNSGKIAGRSSGTGAPVNVALSSGLYWDGDTIAVGAVSGLQATSGKLQGRSSGTGAPVNITLSSGLAWDGDSIYGTVAPVTLTSGTVAGRSSGTGTPVVVTLSSGLYWDGDSIAVNAVSGLVANSGKVQGRSSGTGTPVNVALSSGLAWDGDAIYSTVAGGSVTLNSGTIAGRSSGTGASVGVTLSSGLIWNGDSIAQIYDDIRFHVGGRLTPLSGSPVITGSGFSGATSIHYEQWIDDQIVMYDGTRWNPMTVKTSTMTFSGALSGVPYAVFGVYSGGGFYLDKNVFSGNSVVTHLTTRQDGVLVKSGDATWRYLGVFAPSASGRTESTDKKRLVVNYYNQVPLSLLTCPGYTNDDVSDTYTMSSTTYVELNGGTGARVHYLIPYDGMPVQMFSLHTIQPAASGAVYRGGITIDSAVSPIMSVNGGVRMNTMVTSVECAMDQSINAGFHYSSIVGLRSLGNITVFSNFDRNGASADPFATYMTGEVLG